MTAITTPHAEPTISSLLSTFTTSTTETLSSLPTTNDPTILHPPENGLTLLDAKTEIFLSYLQTLALRNLHVIRTLKESASSSREDDDRTAAAAAAAKKLDDALTKKLVELRVYLERGVRGLEGKIAYSVAKVLRAAEEEERRDLIKEKGRAEVNGKKKKRREAGSKDPSSSSSGGDDDDESETDEEEDIHAAASAHRANAANFLRPNHHEHQQKDDLQRRKNSSIDNNTAGVYRPPRISATSMPTGPLPSSSDRRRGEENSRGPGRSATIDEYVRNELSAAPTAEPSIGSTIIAGGRKTKDPRQMAREQERRDYEETNFVRLPKESKKERAKSAARERGRDQGGFGGEEWRGLGESLDRIGDLTRKGRGPSSMRKEGVLERSRKRRLEDGDGGSAGAGVGQAFEERKRRLTARRERRGR